MTVRRTLPLFILTMLALMLLAYAPSAAIGENRVALVVDFGGGEVETRCVSFTESQITGYQALERSGLPVETDFQTGGAAVCTIDGTGCPANDCFCSCRGGGDCVYWSYWHLVAGAWQYSMGGSGQYMVSDGAVEGWVWGLGSVTQASPPPLVTFAEVCADPAGGASSPTPSLTPIILRTATPVEGDPSQPPTATTTTAPTGTPAPTVAPAQSGATTIATTAATTPVNTPTASLGGQTTPLAPATLAPTQPAAPVAIGETTGSEQTVAPQESPATATPLPPAMTAGPTGAQGYAPPLEPTPGVTTPPETTAATAAPAIAAVVGAGVPAGSGLEVAAGQTTEPISPISYAGFAGLLLLLGALALIVYRRKGGG